MADMGLSYQMIKTANLAREADDMKAEQRKREILILIYYHLTEGGYVDSAQTLSRETNIDLSRHEVCDNIDLSTILMEYESYYYVKFSKYPKITKKPANSSTNSDKGSAGKTRVKKLKLLPPIPSVTDVASPHNDSTRHLRHPPSSFRSRSSSTPSLPRIPQNQSLPSRPKSGQVTNRSAIRKDSKVIVNGGGVTSPLGNDGGLKGLSIQGNPSSVENGQKNKNKFGQIIDCRAMINDVTRLNVEEGSDASDRLLKPLGGYVGYNSEWRELAQVISRDIYSEDPNVRWDDIIGLDSAKRLVKEAVVYPIKYPELFTGILSPWKGLLLYGPPGTGKTLIAKAVATECNTTFFNISASSVVSKWRGDSEKLVRVLFELARFHAPSTIFIDELESIMSQRGSGASGGEHEGSRRLKTELLVQMDGLAKSEDLVFLLAASNLPWELDHAMLRRLEKRIIVDLPTYEARKRMFMHHLPPVVQPKDGGLQLVSEIDYDAVAKLTEGYSGSDIKIVAKEAAMRTVRKIFEALENHHNCEELHIELDTIQTTDVEKALDTMKPSALRLSSKYAAWSKEFESV